MDRIPRGVEPMLADVESYIVQSGLDDMKACADIITTVSQGIPSAWPKLVLIELEAGLRGSNISNAINWDPKLYFEGGWSIAMAPSSGGYLEEAYFSPSTSLRRIVQNHINCLPRLFLVK